MGKYLEMLGKSWKCCENHREIWGNIWKCWENHGNGGKIIGKHGELSGKSWGIIWTIMEKYEQKLGELYTDKEKRWVPNILQIYTISIYHTKCISWKRWNYIPLLKIPGCQKKKYHLEMSFRTHRHCDDLGFVRMALCSRYKGATGVVVLFLF